MMKTKSVLLLLCLLLAGSGQRAAAQGAGVDCTEEYLVEATDFSVTTNNERWNDPLHWTVENYGEWNGGSWMMRGVDNFWGSNCLYLGVWGNRENAVSGIANARIYRRVKLPAGTWHFGAMGEAYQTAKGYIFVADQTCATSELAAKAIATKSVSGWGSNKWLSVSFTLAEEQEVLLGFQVDLTQGSAEQQLIVKEVRLMRGEGAPAWGEYKIEGIKGFVPESKHTLWYTLPASATGVDDPWMEYSLPIGNGQLGGSLFGGVKRDQILLNEKTLWTGNQEVNGASGYFENDHYGEGRKYGSYQVLGNFYAENLDAELECPIRNYVRTLDLENALGTVSYTNASGTVSYSREYFVSNPDGAIVARYSASEPGRISLRFSLRSGKPGVVATPEYTDRGARFGGKLDVVSYDAEMRIVPTGGTMTRTDYGVEVRGADEVMVVLVGATDYDAYSPCYISGTENLVANTVAVAEAAAAKSYDELKSAHVSDFMQFMGRVQFDLGGTNTMPTNELVDAYAKKSNTLSSSLMLEELYFHYARYLSIASSRGVDLPSNLQGIWNHVSNPEWHCDIHSNINVQMNYWPCETGNLTEMHEKFLNYIWNMACNHDEWKYNATYRAATTQTCGWTLFTENNIFGGGGGFMTNYVIANAWYCTHLWQHYRYTLDKDFLARKALPTMWSCCEYWMERLVKAADGTWECPNEYSPEQGPSENATAHSQQLINDLFANTLAAIDVLGADNVNIKAEDIAELRDKYADLDRGMRTETYTGEWGTDRIARGKPIVREWKYSPFTVGQHSHRHSSHLMCLYPLSQLSASNAELFEAAKNTMKLRGDESTGWSMAWKINLWARALDGSRAHSILHTALRHSTMYPTDYSGAAGGIYYNLFDSHSPFQIDGNFGACAGMMEMLLQSHTDTLQLLPALPSTVWRKGSVSGLKAVGGYTVAMQWENRTLTKATISVAHDGRLPISYKNLSGRKVSVNGTEVAYDEVSSSCIALDVKAGDVVEIDMSQTTGINTPTASAQIYQSGAGIYNLSGHRVDSLRNHTVYIQDGKKIAYNY